MDSENNNWREHLISGWVQENDAQYKLKKPPLLLKTRYHNFMSVYKMIQYYAIILRHKALKGHELLNFILKDFWTNFYFKRPLKSIVRRSFNALAQILIWFLTVWIQNMLMT